MKRSDFRFLDRLRVRWAEVDMQQIVFNAHYLMYFDTAISGYWRALALPYQATMHGLQGDLYVKKATLEYHGSARYDDLCEVGMRCARIGTSSMRFDAAVFRGEKPLVGGELLYVFADPSTQTSRPVPAVLRELLEGYEAGQPVLQLQTGPWADLGGPVLDLRQRVLVQEQGLSERLLHDDADAQAVQVLARNRLGLPLAAGRLEPAAPGTGQGRISRMLTRADMRGAGVGRAVLQTLLQAARDRGDTQVVLDAAAEATGFYARAGFQGAGAPFEAEGLTHQPMALRL